MLYHINYTKLIIAKNYGKYVFDNKKLKYDYLLLPYSKTNKKLIYYSLRGTEDAWQ